MAPVNGDMLFDLQKAPPFLPTPDISDLVARGFRGVEGLTAGRRIATHHLGAEQGPELDFQKEEAIHGCLYLAPHAGPHSLGSVRGVLLETVKRRKDREALRVQLEQVHHVAHPDLQRTAVEPTPT